MIGVLALQGDFAEHAATIKALGSSVKLVRSLADVHNISGLILPGGESTAIGKLLRSTKLDTWIKQQAQVGLPIYGTCAGCILIAKQVDSPYSLQLIDITVQRNAYGRQLDSFIADIQFNKKTIPAVFIRAPKITAVGEKVEIIGSYNKKPVLVQQGNILAGAFHPELTTTSEVHRYFIKLVRLWEQRSLSA